MKKVIALLLLLLCLPLLAQNKPVAPDAPKKDMTAGCAPVSRITLPSPDTMTPEQRRVYQKIVGGSRGALVGPLRAALVSPELADRWQYLGEFLRFKTTLPPVLSELSIIVTARRWNSQVEWYIHAAAARKAGLPEGVIEAIRFARPPAFTDATQAVVYEYARQIQQFGQVSNEVYAQAKDKLKDIGVVELTGLVGYYAMVSMTLNAHDIPLPDGAQPPLHTVADGEAEGANKGSTCFTRLTSLPPAQPVAVEKK